jgi:hypothetical protein
MLKITLGLSLLALVAAVPAFAQTFAPAAVVVDAKGQEVGPYFPITQYGPGLSLTTQDFALVRISTSPEIQTLLPVGPNGFGAAEGYYGSILYYTTSNCSGTAYMRPTAGGLTLPTVSYGIVGDVFYYPARTAPEKITSPSYRSLTTTGLGPCGVYGPKSPPAPVLYVTPATTLKLSTLGFRVPFKISQ